MFNSPLTLYLARHGETDWNRQGRWQGQTDIPLNRTGEAQARALAGRLLGRGITEIHTSDLVRARRTGEIAAEVLGQPLRGIHPGLRERNFGILEGRTREELEDSAPDLAAAARAGQRIVPPGAEPHESVVTRMQITIDTIYAGLVENGGRALVISHGGAIRIWLGARTGVDIPPLSNAALFEITIVCGEIQRATLLVE